MVKIHRSVSEQNHWEMYKNLTAFPLIKVNRNTADQLRLAGMSDERGT